MNLAVQEIVAFACAKLLGKKYANGLMLQLFKLPKSPSVLKIT